MTTNIIKAAQIYITEPEGKKKESLKETIKRNASDRAATLEESIINRIRDIIKSGDEKTLESLADQETTDNVYLNGLWFDLAALATPCSVLATIGGSKTPTYHAATAAALRRAKGHIKNICLQTGCNLESAYPLTARVVDMTISNTFDIYNKDVSDEIQKAKRESMKSTLLAAQTAPKEGEAETEEHQKAVKERERLHGAYIATLQRYEPLFYKGDKVAEETEKIILSIFPNLKPDEAIKEVVQSVQRAGLEGSYFEPMYNANGLNNLFATTIKKAAVQANPITGEGMIKKDENYTVFIKDYEKLRRSLKISTLKLLDFLTVKFTQNNGGSNNGLINASVMVSLEDYMKYCGIPITESSKKETRKKINGDMNFLFNVSLSFDDGIRDKRQRKNYPKTRLTSKYYPVRNNMIKFEFDTVISEYLAHETGYIMQYPTKLLTVDERNPSTYRLGRKLSNHYCNFNNRKKGNYNSLSVKTLLEWCPDIPTVEDVKTSRGSFNQKIQEPFEKALDSLESKGILSSWEYCNKSKTPLTEAQISAMSFNDFMEFYVHFELTGAPDQSERMAKKEAEKKAATQKRSHHKKADKE